MGLLANIVQYLQEPSGQAWLLMTSCVRQTFYIDWLVLTDCMLASFCCICCRSARDGESRGRTETNIEIFSRLEILAATL